jgi:putative Mg2+ transporter-C (MgtC) family protein
VTHALPAISQLEFAGRVLCALAFGSLIGLERQWRQRMAGLRTNALVATGTSLFVMVTPLLGNPGNITQIAAYVVSGIGFLAGGVIFKERLSVSGLNTAATLWCTAAVGMLVGFGFVAEGAIGVAAVLFVHVVLRPIVALINRRPIDETELVSSFEIRAVCGHDLEERVRATLIAAIRLAKLTLIAVYSEETEAANRVDVIADVTVAGQRDARLEEIVMRVGLEPGVYAISWKAVLTNDEERELTAEA